MGKASLMNPGILLKKLLAFIRQSAIKSSLSNLTPEYCLILTYHRVLPPSHVAAGVEPGMYVTPATLHEHVQFLKNRIKK